MWQALKALLKQQYWVMTLFLGVALVGISCINLDKDRYWSTHSPDPVALFAVGIVLLLASILSFIYSLKDPVANSGLHLDLVAERGGIFSTYVGDCEVRVAKGRVEDYAFQAKGSVVVVVLPCNEYFDDECAGDIRSALGAYVNKAFKDNCSEFLSLVKQQCAMKFGPGVEQQKTENQRAISFGTGHCVFFQKPLGQDVSVALVSTTTQRSGYGLMGRISYLFDAMRELFTCLADVRVSEIIMPIMGAGHGRIHPPLAFIGLLIAVAEAARHGRGSERPRKVTIVVFKRDRNTPAEVDDVVIRRGLALIAFKELATAIPSPRRRRAA
jgi:hypothetical protein